MRLVAFKSAIATLSMVTLIHSAAAQAVKTEPYTWRSVTIKANGFIDGIVFSPVERGLFYIHTDMGGAYRHEAKTGQWVCLTDWVQHDDFSLNQMGVETMALDPEDEDRVYAGIGTYMGPSAVIRSTDRGETWQRTNVPFGMNGNGSARNAGERMNVDPNLRSRLIYGTRTSGLWESSDYAATWTKIESFPATGEQKPPCTDAGIVWTLFDKSSGQPGVRTPIAYAGVCTTAAEKVFRTVDGGNAWEAIPGQPGGALLPTRAAIAPDGSFMYLTYIIGEGYPGPHGAVGGDVYRVDQPNSSAPTWTKISPATGKFGWSGVAIDPTNPQVVYVSTLCRYGEVKDDIYRSTDGGKTWAALGINTHRDDSSAPYVVDFGMHWVGDVQIDPHDKNHALFTTGWGMYRTTELQKPNPTWAFYNEGFEQSAVLELCSPPNGTAHLLSAIGDRDGYIHDDFAVSPKLGRFGQPNSAGQIDNMAIGTNRSMAFAWNDPNVLARIGDYQSQYSLDGGKTWHWFEKPNLKRRENGRPTQVSIAVSADGKNVVRAPRNTAVVRSERTVDGFSAWAECSGIPQGEWMLAADLIDPSTFYARGDMGIFASNDGGATWSIQTSSLPDEPHWIRATPGKKGHLWLSAGKEGAEGLHRSIDGGKTWSRVAEDVVAVAKQVGLGAPAVGGDYPAVFVGGTVGGLRGFFRSDDQGKSWVRINDDKHHYGNVTVITGDPRVHGRLYVGTNGRGILYAERSRK